MPSSRFNNSKRRWLFIGLLAIIFWSFQSIKWGKDLIHGGGYTTMLQILSAMVHPNMSLSILKLGLISTIRTLVYAFSGLSVAMFLGFFLSLCASKVLGHSSSFSKLRITVSRRLLGFMRAIHELVWALLFVASIGLSPIAGVMALGIPYGGMLGRIWADLFDNVDEGVINALNTSGASKFQTLIYGYLPLILPDMISYTLYRLECGVRSSTVMSFVGLGGLGYQIQLSLSDLEYTEVWTFLYMLVFLIFLINFWSHQLRRRLQYGL